MHILTKVFVLFAAVLSIMMAALAISYSVNADRVVADYRDAMARADSAVSALSAANASSAQQKLALDKNISSLEDELASRDADTRRLEASNSELRFRTRQAEVARESITFKIAQLGDAVKSQAQIINEYKDRITRLTTQELDTRDKMIDIEKTLSDLKSQVIVYEQVKRAREEQIEELRALVGAQANGGGANRPNAAFQAPVEVAGPMIQGTIDRVQTDPASGELLVQINLGSNDRIRTNSRLYIHRNNDIYLGDLIVQSVDLNHAVARVSYSIPGQSIRVGDKVMSKLGS
ncbi:MAG: hypothetical protein JKY96_03475 [Phycisphaerales bacterium]|nr:hypothetical protein [Phycisphaerales bacterium]